MLPVLVFLAVACAILGGFFSIMLGIAYVLDCLFSIFSTADSVPPAMPASWPAISLSSLSLTSLGVYSTWTSPYTYWASVGVSAVAVGAWAWIFSGPVRRKLHLRRELMERLDRERKHARQQRELAALPWTPGPFAWQLQVPTWPSLKVASRESETLVIDTNREFMLTLLQETRAGKKRNPQWMLVDPYGEFSTRARDFPSEQIASILAASGQDPLEAVLETSQFEAAIEPIIAPLEAYFGPQKTGWKKRYEDLKPLEPQLQELAAQLTTYDEAARDEARRKRAAIEFVARADRVKQTRPQFVQ